MSEEEKKSVFKADKLSIVDFRIIKGEIDVDFSFSEKLIKNFQTDMTFDVTFDAENNSLKADMGFTIVTNSDGKAEREAEAKFKFVYIYELENFGDLVEVKNGKIAIINEHLMPSVAAISFSTSRGILMTRLQGTAMKDYILPIINPDDLIKDE